MAELKRYLITRVIPGVNEFTPQQLKEASQTSNAALAELKGDVEWENSFVVHDKTYCVYKAKVPAPSAFADASVCRHVPTPDSSWKASISMWLLHTTYSLTRFCP